MALIAFAGFEDNNLLEIAPVGSPVLITSSPTPRTGTYALKVPGTQSTIYANGWVMLVDSSEFYFQYAVAKGGTGHDESYVFRWRDNAGNTMGSFVIRTAYTLDVYVGTTTYIGSISTSISASWSVIEGYIKIDDSAGRVVIKSNGITHVDFTGDTKPGTATVVDNIQHGNFVDVIYANSLFFYFDDIVVNDTTGSSFNSWPMGIKCHKLAAPSANGYYAQWTPVGASTNYQCIDDVSPSMDDYIEGVTGNKDSYAFGDSPAIDGIAAVVTRYYGQGGGNIKRLCRHNSTDYLSAGITVPGTFNKVEEVMYEKPGGGDWDVVTLNACEFGAEQE